MAEIVVTTHEFLRVLWDRFLCWWYGADAVLAVMDGTGVGAGTPVYIGADAVLVVRASHGNRLFVKKSGW